MASEKKLSYEEMEKKVAALELMIKQQEAQFVNQRNAMTARMQELYDALNYRRLDFLFKVVEHSDKFASEFVTTCVEEIERTMTIPETPVEETDKKEE